MVLEVLAIMLPENESPNENPIIPKIFAIFLLEMLEPTSVPTAVAMLFPATNDMSKPERKSIRIRMSPLSLY